MECSGTCKLTKVLQTAPPVPHANRSMHIMEQVQCDLITVTSQKGGFSSAQHDFKYILSVKDCFSKFCWLTPLESKEAGPIASVLARIFRDCGPPKYLQSDNGKEFVNKILGFLCKNLGIHTKHGRPYHPQSQGQVENLNKRVKNCLRHFLLRYTEEERCDMWPFVIQDVAYFINHSWHHTIKSTPHTIFFGRSPKCSTFDSHNNTGFMPEDFMFADDNEDTLTYAPEIGPSNKYVLPDYTQVDQNTLLEIAEHESLQREQKRDVFEAAESAIVRNRRAHIKRIKYHEYLKGDKVWIKNPSNHSIVSTLNVQGEVLEKVGRDLYKVAYNDSTIVTFGSQMVPCSSGDKDMRTAEVSKSRNTLSQLEVLDKITSYADVQRNRVVTRWKIEEAHMDLSEVLHELGVTECDLSSADDLTALYYLALDCGFLANLTQEQTWKNKLELYNTTILQTLQQKQYQYFLSGIHFWDSFRSQTIPILMQSLSAQVVPVFHYCSQCLENGPCSHQCCRVWLTNICVQCGLSVKDNRSHEREIERSDNKPVPPKKKSSQHLTNGLQLLAAAAEQLEPIKYPTIHSYKSLKLHKLKLRRTTRQKHRKHPYKHSIEMKVDSILLKRGLLKKRIKPLQLQIRTHLEKWQELSATSQKHLYTNVMYIDKVLNRHSLCRQEVRLVGSLPFMQIQGRSNYCGLCAINNAFGEEKMTIERMNYIADDLWLRQFEQLHQSLTDSIQHHRDINGFYSFHVLEEVAHSYGYFFDILHPSIKAIIQCTQAPPTPQSLVNALKHTYTLPLPIVLVDTVKQHYITIKVDPYAIWLFDSLKKKPQILSPTELMAQLQMYCNSAYAMVSRSHCNLQQPTSSDNEVCIVIHIHYSSPVLK